MIKLPESFALHLDNPIYTVADVARIIDEPYHIVYHWAKESQEKPPLVSRCYSFPEEELYIAFVGLAEAYTVSILRKYGLSTRQIRTVVKKLSSEFKIEHPLASNRFRIHGAEVLDNLGIDNPELVTVKNNKKVFRGIMEDFLSGVTYADDGYPRRFYLIQYKIATVMVDPGFSSGEPVYYASCVRLIDTLERLRAGETLAGVAADFSTPPHEIEEAWKFDRAKAA